MIYLLSNFIYYLIMIYYKLQFTWHTSDVVWYWIESDGEVPVLNFSRVLGTRLLLLLPAQLRSGVIFSVRSNLWVKHIFFFF